MDFESTDAPVDGLRPPPDGPPVDRLEEIARLLLVELGEDPNRAGLIETPARFARWWREFLRYDSGKIETLFETANLGQTVIVSDIAVWSLCEHHLLPFTCSVTIAYIPRESILGLSKFARIAHEHAHRLQVQERLTSDIALDVSKVTGSPDVAVIVRGEHLCMAMRGIRSSAMMTSTAWSGQFQTDQSTRVELLALLGREGRKWSA